MGSVQHFDLCIIGSGSGNSIVDERFAGLSVALIDEGTFGGTCLNVGCIPTKMYVYPADLAIEPAHAREVGVDLELRGVRWVEIRDRIFGRIDPISAGGLAWRQANANVTVFPEAARFVASKTLDVATAGVITADRFVIAAGSRITVPDFPGLDQVRYYTSDDVMRLPRLPKSMIIVGAGYVAAEFAHVFSAFGVQVHVVGRKSVLLRNEDEEVSQRFTELLGRRVELHLTSTVEHIDAGEDGRVQVQIRNAAGEESLLEGEVLLMATGRRPNGDTLDLTETGVELDDGGYVRVDEFQRTTAEGIFALGDVSSHHQLKHVANHEARVVQHNLLHPDAPMASDHRFIPHAVFSEPQVAAVGLTEREAAADGLDYSVGRTDYGSTAYGWAMEDHDHFVKVIAESRTGQLLGAHLIGPQASLLIQPLIQAMHFDTPAYEVARGQYWIHPAMTEVVENALLSLKLDS